MVIWNRAGTSEAVEDKGCGVRVIGRVKGLVKGRNVSRRKEVQSRRDKVSRAMEEN